MKLFEVQATEYNGEQEYFQSKLFAAENIDWAWEVARGYFRQWYDDGDEPEYHNTDNRDEFEFVGGCIRLKIKNIQETTLDEWMKSQIRLHSIAELPDELMTRRITGSAADLLEACKVLTSYTTDLLYRLDNQINLDGVEELQQAKDAIAKYNPAETPSTKLRNVCQQMLDTLDIGGEQARQFAEEIAMLKDALKAAPAVKDDCPKCGAGSDEREFASRDFLGIEAIHMHYLCKKCGSEIIEEFTLTDIFIDNLTT
ncbi:MAG: hypothetical protein DRP65_00810 [Planctomycetota bacterium]|nr:MAG: hypothetical protein DRP65_00810 [Planctomycetota bacterium]